MEAKREWYNCRDRAPVRKYKDTIKPITTTNYHSLAAGVINTLTDSESETVKLKFNIAVSC